MKRLLSTTAALSLAFANVQPWPLMAQTMTEDGSVIASDGTVLCQPTADAACNPDDYVAAAQAIDEQIQAEAQAQAEAEAAAQAEAEAAAQAEAEAAAQAEAEAAAQAEADAAAQAEADAAAQAEAEAAAQAEADAAAQAEAEAAAQAEADAAAQAEAEAAAQAEAEAAAQAEAEAAAQAEAEAAAQAEAEAAAQAEADAAAAAEAEAATQAEEQPAVDETVTEEEAAPEEAAPEEATTEEAAPAEVAPEEAVVEEAAPAEAATEEAAPAEAATEEVAPAEAAPEEAAPEETVVEPAPAEEAVAQEPTEPATMSIPDAEAPVEDAAAGMKSAEPDPALFAEPVEAPVATEVQVEKLSEILAEPDAVDATELGAAATLMSKNPEADAAAGVEDTSPAIDKKTGKVIRLSEQAASEDAAVTIETLSETTTRKSSEEFYTAPVQLADGKKDRLSDLEKVGLVALGALVVGAIINEGRKDERRVVSNTGDRIVVLKPDGTYQVYKDDDAVLRRPGSTVRTETFNDGSTRTIVDRPDGTQIVTIRDASGRVLRRAQYDDLGRELVLIDDLEPEQVVIVSELPKPRPNRVTISTSDENAALKAALAAKEAAKAGRKFSLRQIREIPEVRALSATIDVDSMTFDSGSAAIKASQAENLADLGGLMQDLLDANPGEMFLIEGHTDAVGKAPLNLALSDRRAESVALALTEYFDIPPENMVIQGYGESELLIDTQTDERLNRRVVVRVITPLLKTSG